MRRSIVPGPSSSVITLLIIGAYIIVDETKWHLRTSAQREILLILLAVVHWYTLDILINYFKKHPIKMKSKFLAGLIATIIALVVVIGLALFLALVLEIDASQNWFTYSAAFLTIGAWTGVYSWLKPKESESEQDNEDLPPAREENF